MTARRSLLCLLVTLALLAGACGDTSESTVEDALDPAADATVDSDDTNDDSGDAQSYDESVGDETGGDEQGGEGFPVTIESLAGSFTLESAPERIVSLSPSATEILFAIGAGDQVVAVDAFSNYPAEAPITDLSGWDPNVEAIVGYEPDLVVIANDANDLIAGLTELAIPVLANSAPIDVESGYAGMTELGLATGNVDQTAKVVATMRADMDAALGGAPSTPVRVYHELDETFFSASSNGFVGSIYASMGAINIADEADVDGTGFPQLTEEYIVDADPQLIIITDQVAYGPDEVAARPGWADVSAVKNGNVVVVSADVSSRWGPRLPQFFTTVADVLNSSAEVASG